EPAVCTRSSGLPTAPRASARYSSGIMTPSNRSGALPSTTASIWLAVSWASASARSTASRQSPAIDTSVRLLRCWVCPVPRTAARCFTALSCSSSLHDADEVLLQGGSAGGVPERHLGPARHDFGGRQPDPRKPRGEHWIAAQRTARRADDHVLAEVQCAAQDDLLVRKRRVQFGDLGPARSGSFARCGGRW